VLQGPLWEIDNQVPRKYYVASDAEEHGASASVEMGNPRGVGKSKSTAIPQRRRSKPRSRRITRLLRTRIRQARYLVVLLGSLVVADGVISNFIVQSGSGMEGNPFLQSIVGQTGFVFLKLSGALSGALILWRVFRRHTRLGLVSIIFFAVAYTAILWWNLATWFIGSYNLQS